jgi:hypothetical protein
MREAGKNEKARRFEARKARKGERAKETNNVIAGLYVASLLSFSIFNC